MIKINLQIGSKSLDIKDVGGFDFSKLNIKYFVAAIAISYVPDLFVYSEFETSLQEHRNEQSTLQAKSTKLKEGKKGFTKFETEYEALNDLKSKLAEKLALVKKIISTKKNPTDMMMYFSKNIPEGMRLSKCSIDQDQLSIQGESKDFSSIGVFLQSLKSSIFFGKDLKLESTKTVEGSGIRYEAFTIKGTISRYN